MLRDKSILTSPEAEVVHSLRRQIVRGRFGLGNRLPSRSALASEFNASLTTVQKAMERLEREGFVRTGARRLGTVVVEQPPHLCHYGLLFPWLATRARPWPRSWQVIAEASRALLETAPGRLSLFDEGDPQKSIASYQTFLDDVSAHRLAGLIVPALPVPHLTDLIRCSGGTLPIVAYASASLPGVASVHQTASAAARILDYLQARGHRKIGQLIPGAWFESPHYEAEFLRPLPQRGMRCERRWLQVLLPQAPQGVRNAAELLAGSPNGPDAIIVHDDNAVQAVIDGIQAAGKRIPDDIELVAWGNFPWPEIYTAPVKRFGVDMMQLVSGAKAYIDACRSGENPEPVIELDACEDDIDRERRKQQTAKRRPEQ